MNNVLEALLTLLTSTLEIQTRLIELEIAQATKRQEEDAAADFEGWMRDAWR